jgi:hypothetical protein
MLRITGFLDFVHCLIFYKPEKNMFQKLVLLLSSGEKRETPTLLGLVEKANLSLDNPYHMNYSYTNI